MSFDVFDTVITRKTGEPSLVYLQLGIDVVRRGIVRCTPETFMRLRMAAESRARQNWAPREVTLREIYRELAFSLRLEGVVEALMDAELRAEREAICVIPEMQATVDIVRRKYGRVLFISDMYLPEEFLRDRLQALGLMQGADTLYMSCNHGCWKTNGDLFRAVLQREKLQPGDLFHCGNSHEADIEGARSAGISAFHYEPANPNVSEEILNRHALRSEGVSGEIAGASRLVRLQGTHLGAQERVVWDTAASVTGPLVLMFARWLIDRAVDTGVKKLLFLARDAYLPYVGARALLAQRPDIDLEIEYVYGSRATYVPLGIRELGETEWVALFSTAERAPSTVNDVRNSLRASEATFTRYLSPLGFGPDEWNRPLQPGDLDMIKRHVLSDAEFNRAIMLEIEGFQQLSRQYFRQRGVDGLTPIGLVDTGWTTRSHAPLVRFLEAEAVHPVRVFYFGVNVNRSERMLDTVETFLFDQSQSLGVRSRHFQYARAVETLFPAGHGRTIGFELRGALVEPVLNATDNREFTERFFPIYERGVTALVQLAAPLFHSAGVLHDHRELADELLRRFWSRPTKQEAEVWVGLHWESDVLGRHKHRLARPYRFRDGWHVLLRRGYPEPYKQFWVGAAYALTPRRKRIALKAALRFRSGLSRLVRMMPPGLARLFRGVKRRLI